MVKLFRDISYAALWVAFFLSSPADSKVKPIPFDELIKKADVIMVARVVEIKNDSLVSLYAKNVLKGKAPRDRGVIRASIANSWACDISGAKQGELALWFLERTEKAGLYRIAFSGRGRWPVVVENGIELVAPALEVVRPKEWVKKRVMLTDVVAYVRNQLN